MNILTHDGTIWFVRTANGQTYYALFCCDPCDLDKSLLAVSTSVGEWGRTLYTIDTANGRASSQFHGNSVYGSIENGAGYCIGLVLVDPTTHVETVYAIGVEADQWAMAELFGVSSTDFSRESEVSAVA